MTIKEIIKSFEELNFEIFKLVTRKEELLELNGFPKHATNERVKTSGHNAMAESLVIKLEEIDEKINAINESKEKLTEKLLVFLEPLELTEKWVVEERLVKGKIWKQISTWQGYSQGHIRRIYRQALNKITNGEQEYGI